MRENELLKRLCSALTEILGRECIPETWRDGCISVFLAGGGGGVRSYVHGGGIVALPLEIKMRSVMRCEADRLRVLDVLSEIADAADEGISLGGVKYARLRPSGSVRKTKTHENASEEYTAPCVLEYYAERERATF